MVSINKIDKYGFSQLLYAEYWKNDELARKRLINQGASHVESLKEYLNNKNKRDEVLNIYKQVTLVNVKEFINEGYSNYLDNSYNLSFDGIGEDDLWRYLDSIEVKSNILKEFSKFITFNVKKFIEKGHSKYLDHSYHLSFDGIREDDLWRYLLICNSDEALLYKFSQYINFDTLSKDQKRIFADKNYSIDLDVKELKNNIKYKLYDLGTLRSKIVSNQREIIDNIERIEYEINRYGEDYLQEKLKYSEDELQLVNKQESDLKPSIEEFFLAIQEDDTSQIVALFERGAEVNLDILKIVVKNENCTVLKTFFESNRIEPRYINETFDENMDNILLYATSHTQNIQIISLLIDNGADINIENQAGETVLDFACSRNSVCLVKFFIDNKIVIEDTIYYGDKKTSKERFIDLLMSCTNMDIVDLLIQHRDSIVEEYIVWNSFVEKYENQKKYKTPLSYAVAHYDRDIIELLINNGEDINEKTKDGNTALELSAKLDKEENFKYIYSLEGSKINNKILDYLFMNKSNLIDDLVFNKWITLHDIIIKFISDTEKDVFLDDEIIKACNSDELRYELLCTLVSNTYTNKQIDIMHINMIKLLEHIAKPYIDMKIIDHIEKTTQINIEFWGNDNPDPIPDYSYKDIDSSDLVLKPILIFLDILKKLNTDMKNIKLDTDIVVFNGYTDFVNILMKNTNIYLTDILVTNSMNLIHKRKGDSSMEQNDTLIDTFIKEFKFDKLDDDIDVAFDRTKEICAIFKKYFPEENEKLEKFIIDIEDKKNFDIDINEDEIPF